MIITTVKNKIYPVCKIAHDFATEMGSPNGPIEPQHIKGALAGCYPVEYQPRWCSGPSSRLVESAVKRTVLPTYDSVFKYNGKPFTNLVRITLPVCKMIEKVFTKNAVSWPKQTRFKGEFGKMDEANLNKIRMVRY